MREVIRRFLAIAGEPDEAAAALRALVADAKLDADPALDLFESRTGFLAARGIDVSRIVFSTSYGRGLDYYTGLVFELHDPAKRIDRYLVAGGRYDGMLSRLGSAAPIPAVGFSAWIERLAAIGDQR
jgi:ATP phosphoribosyltransferase regulatory subunit